jgi:hypothetical protein
MIYIHSQHISLQPSLKSTIEFVRPINSMVNLKMRCVGDIFI